VDQPRTRTRGRYGDADADGWSDGRSEPRSDRRLEPRLEQRLDQWMTTGRQLVDGVAGARPGSRPLGRGAGSATGPRLRPGDLGRWVERKIDWLLEDDDGWREPWQGPPVEPVRRRPLEAISRRGTPLLPDRRREQPDPDDWPDDGSFSVERWRRPSAPAASVDPAPGPEVQRRPSGRALPRSSRRRLD